MGEREGCLSHREKGGMTIDAHVYFDTLSIFLTWKVGRRAEGRDIGRQSRNLDEGMV
jgi:hypothetical protein